ncbi:type II CRISPR RNA-guided endonuclease Cas9 [Candidatus Spongiihabitans sp.]|uniref:type II CRISPR RNA-guided endonuclease Cas9 n=1 Tax=Candidatus Spongiihabitans sp. TaxID=3101308 RepID=UPI003C7B7B0F
MSKKILGLDLGSNSIGWALLEEKDGQAVKIIDIGTRIFTKAVEEKVPTPKNQKRRQMRLGRRVLQRRARRKQKMLNYLVSLDLLPKELLGNTEPEKLLNQIGDPYELRTKALDERLSPHQLGRILLHFVARRGFLSSKKQAAGDLVDDPDTMRYLNKLDAKTDSSQDKEEGDFKADIAKVYRDIEDESARTLGEYLYRSKNRVKRNRAHEGGHLRTDRAMYQDELKQIWQKQVSYFAYLPDDFMADNKGVKKIIFYQRPLKLKKDRVGRCSLEPKHYRANTARLEVQRFRYLQDINNLKYLDRHLNKLVSIKDAEKAKLVTYFDHHPKITITKLKNELNLDRFTQINLDAKNLKGNITACEIRSVIGEQWDEMSDTKQKSLFEDLFTIKKKSALKNRLIVHWNFDKQTAIKLCLLEFEPSHSNHSLKAINKLLPHLEKGMIYSDARQAAGYGYEIKEIEVQEKLSSPPETSNPIVNKGLHELRRVVNALIKEYGKPDAIRIEMARDLEMNTERVKDFIKQQKQNEKTNEDAQNAFTEETGRKYSSRDDNIKYRLWLEQECLCIYSGVTISRAQLFSDAIEIDHIVPKSLCLDDSYINKVVCLTRENRFKGQRTPVEAWGRDEEKWNQITQRIDSIYKDRPRKKYRKYSTHPKKKQFYMKQEDIEKKYGMSAAQLNDTRYISTVTQEYVKELGCDVSVTKGAIVAEVRYWWGLNSLLGKTDQKKRTDHRHHAIDAAVIACINRQFHTKATQSIKRSEETGQKVQLNVPYLRFRTELEEKLERIVVSHAPQRKLSGSLHKKTGYGHIKGKWLVTRHPLNAEFTESNADTIVDSMIRKIVLSHLEKYGNDPKKAFSEKRNFPKVGKNVIKRVRILKPKTTFNNTISKEHLESQKFGIKNTEGKYFKWHDFGNIHHIEIIRHKQTGEIKGEFVTMMLASHRVKGINMPKQPMIKVYHGKDYEFLMALHINDTVSIANENGECVFYRVQKLDSGTNRIMLRLSKAATLDKKDEELLLTINQKNFEKHKIQLHHINAIGYPVND